MTHDIEITHNGYKIHHSTRAWEGFETWRCNDLDMEHEKLAKLKAKIDAYEAKYRKLKGGIKVIVVKTYWHGAHEVSRKIATSIDKGGGIWTTKSGNRSKEKMEDLMWDTPRNLELYSAAMAVKKDAKALEDKGNEMIKAIPRITMEELKEHRVSEDDE